MMMSFHYYDYENDNSDDDNDNERGVKNLIIMQIDDDENDNKYANDDASFKQSYYTYIAYLIDDYYNWQYLRVDLDYTRISFRGS